MPDDQPLPPTGTPGPASVLPSQPPYPPPAPPAMPPWATPAGPPPPPWGAPPPPSAAHPAARWRPRRGPALAALVVLVVLAAAAALGGWLSTSGSSSGPTPADTAAARRLVSGALDAARRAGSFHYVSSSSSPSVTQQTIGDAGPSSGRQVITLGTDTFTVLVVGPTAYFQGDAAAMVENLSVPLAVAQAHAGQWISLSSGDAPYQSVYAAVTTSDALHDNITFGPRTVLGTSTVAGQRVVGVRGPIRGVPGSNATGTATLYLSDSGSHLPVRYVEQGTLRGSDGSTTPLQFRIDFSAWGETVQVQAPPGAVSFASLGVPGGTGNGGSSPPTTLVT